jgi:hypothetical protein
MLNLFYRKGPGIDGRHESRPAREDPDYEEVRISLVREAMGVFETS